MSLQASLFVTYFTFNTIYQVSRTFHGPLAGPRSFWLSPCLDRGGTSKVLNMTSEFWRFKGNNFTNLEFQPVSLTVKKWHFTYFKCVKYLFFYSCSTDLWYEDTKLFGFCYIFSGNFKSTCVSIFTKIGFQLTIWIVHSADIFKVPKFLKTFMLSQKEFRSRQKSGIIEQW